MDASRLSPILALTDAQITSIMQLTRPLQPDQRVAFFEMLATALRGQTELGDGWLFRTCRDLQRELLDFPDLSRSSGSSKYG
jgi:hypothetical protein